MECVFVIKKMQLNSKLQLFFLCFISLFLMGSSDYHAQMMLDRIKKIPLVKGNERAIELAVKEMEQFSSRYREEISSPVREEIKLISGRLQTFQSLIQKLQGCGESLFADQITSSIEIHGFGKTDRRKRGFFKDLYREYMLDLSKAWFLYRYTFNLDPDWEKLCYESACPNDLKNEIARLAEESFSKFEERGVNQLTSKEEILKQLNTKIARIEHLRSRVTPLEETDGFGYDTSPESWPVERTEALSGMEPLEAAKIILKNPYEKYRDEYLLTISSGVGQLLLSPVLQEKAGKFVPLEDGLEIPNARFGCHFGSTTTKIVHNKRGRYHVRRRMKSLKKTRCVVAYDHDHLRYKPFGQVFDIGDVKMAIEQIGEHILKTAHTLGKGYIQQRKSINYVMDDPEWLHWENTTNREIDSLVSSSPSSVGNLLENKPYYVREVCQALARIQKKDHTDKMLSYIFDYGGIVVGVGLLGSAIVLPFLGIPIVTTAWIVGAGGAVLTTVELPYRIKEFQETGQKKDLLMGAFFASDVQRDESTLREMERAVEEFQESKLGLALLAGFSVFDVLEVGLLLRSYRALKNLKTLPFSEISDAEKIEQLDYLSHFFRNISKNFSPDGKNFANDNLFRWTMEYLGQNKMGDFLTILANSLRYQHHGHSRLAEKLFIRLGEMNRDEFVGFVESTLEISRKHSTSSLEAHYRAQIKHIRQIIRNPHSYHLSRRENYRESIENKIEKLDIELKKAGLAPFSTLSRELRLEKEWVDFLLSLSPKKTAIILASMKDEKFTRFDVWEFFNEWQRRTEENQELTPSRFYRHGDMDPNIMCKN